MRTSLTAVVFAAGLICACAPTAIAAPSPRAAPVNVVSPQITGKARVGQTLSASQGEWDGQPTAFFYQWLRCDSAGGSCAPAPGATEPKYLLGDDDLGHRIRVEVVAMNADGASPARRSSGTAVVQVPAPTVVAKPTISGVPREGETLSAAPGSWTGEPTSFVYEWKRCFSGTCSTIGGATAQSYALGGTDVGTRIRVRVAAVNAGGRSEKAGSASTATIKQAAAGLSLGPAKRDRKRGLARFHVTVPAAGRLTLVRTAKVRGESRTVAGARVVKLTLKPRRPAKKKLRRHGSAKVRAIVTFTPEIGAARQKTRRVRLVLR